MYMGFLAFCPHQNVATVVGNHTLVLELSSTIQYLHSYCNGCLDTVIQLPLCNQTVQRGLMKVKACTGLKL